MVIVNGLGIGVSVYFDRYLLQPPLLGPLIKRTNPQLTLLLRHRLLNSLSNNTLQV